MKRYILVAILALMTLVGCKVGEGTERDPNGSKKMLWHRVYSSVYSAYYYGNFAVYSDIVLSNNKEALEVMKESCQARSLDFILKPVWTNEGCWRKEMLESDLGFRKITVGSDVGERAQATI